LHASSAIQPLRVRPFALILLCLFAGCEPLPETQDRSQATALDDSLRLAEQEAAAEAQRRFDAADYRVSIGGAMADTLSGAARFGPMIDARTNKELIVVRLETGIDFGGGYLLSYAGTDLPAPGRYEINPFPPDSVRSDQLHQGWSARYRRGLLVNLRAESGTITLDTVTDTLIAGSFEIDLVGTVAAAGGTPVDGEVTTQGDFRARSGVDGFLIGF
jgi:hypothetical protein